MTDSSQLSSLEDQAMAMEWFYPFKLPSGRVVPQYVAEEINVIHYTRLQMMRDALERELADGSLTAIDLSSHQGYFSLALAPHCSAVVGLEYQERHVQASSLMRDALGFKNVKFFQENLETMRPGKHEPADIVINFGLMYNLENPIAVLRRSRELTKRVLLIETQTTILDLEGAVDSGHYNNTNYMHGYFGLFSGNPQNIDGSASDIVMYPSPGGLMWILKKLGFRTIRKLETPQGGYQQLATGKRVMIEARL